MDKCRTCGKILNQQNKYSKTECTSCYNREYHQKNKIKIYARRKKYKKTGLKSTLKRHTRNGEMIIATANEDELSLQNNIEHEQYLKEVEKREAIRKKTGGRLI